tara:strand:- start:1808 stop:2101 length:294 start_codon:yes stop_codon:yes gene_type:complete
MDLKEYYEHYLTLHQNKRCRALHFLGQCVTILYVTTVVIQQAWLLLLAAPFIVYPFAWSGHYFFEKNEPAAFSAPIKAKISDWLMFRDVLMGRIKIW